MTANYPWGRLETNFHFRYFRLLSSTTNVKICRTKIFILFSIDCCCLKREFRKIFVFKGKK